jgi:hypothetical protein
VSGIDTSANKAPQMHLYKARDLVLVDSLTNWLGFTAPLGKDSGGMLIAYCLGYDDTIHSITSKYQ